MKERPCTTCGHPVTDRCYRLTCPVNGARQSFDVVRPGDNLDRKQAPLL